MAKKLNKKGQVTIFVIIALIIVVSMLLLFLLFKAPEPEIIDEDNPQAFIESCTREAVEEALDILMPQGGDINPKGSLMYYNINRTYLCYNANYYLPCINQRPMLIEHVENEINNYIEPRVANCFNILKSKLEERYAIETGDMNLNTKIGPNQISVKINKYFKISKEDKTITFEEFKINIIHPIYDILKIAMEIVDQEIRFCNFDILGYMVFYPRFGLEKLRPGNSETIYKIKDRTTNEEFIFAIRSCALPPGF